MLVPGVRASLKLTGAPAAEPVSVAEVRAWLDIGSEVADSTLTSLIAAARQDIDGAAGWLGRALVTQTWQLRMDRFPCGEIRLPLRPLQSVDSVVYADVDGVDQTISADDYAVETGEAALLLPAYGKSWPAARCFPGSVRVTYVAGYGAAADVPEPIRQAIALQVGHLRSLSGRDPLLRRETVDGVSTQEWEVGEGAAAALTSAADALLSPYRVW